MSGEISLKTDFQSSLPLARFFVSLEWNFSFPYYQRAWMYTFRELLLIQPFMKIFVEMWKTK